MTTITAQAAATLAHQASAHAHLTKITQLIPRALVQETVPGRNQAVLDEHDVRICWREDSDRIAVYSWSTLRFLWVGTANHTEVDLLDPSALDRILYDLRRIDNPKQLTATRDGWEMI